jgi:hypothetical protein
MIKEKKKYNVVEGIGFTARAWHEIPFQNTVAFTEIAKALSEATPISAYGDGLVEILFVFLCFPYASDLHKSHFRIYKKDKMLYIVKPLDYVAFQSGDVENARKMQCALFLENIALLNKKKIPDFDAARFYQDVKRLFEEKNWVE